MPVRLKRVYEGKTDQDGVRILVDRLWPRGLSKDKAEIDLWLKDVAPSSELRRWFGHDPAKWQDFRDRYRRELEQNELPVATLRNKAEAGTVTLLYAARDTAHNHAVALRDFLEMSDSRAAAGRPCADTDGQACRYAIHQRHCRGEVLQR